MQPFSYQGPDSLAEVLARLSAQGSLPPGGDIVLLAGIEEEVAPPVASASIQISPGGNDVDWRSDGSVRIAAGARIGDLADDRDVRGRLSVLAEACRSVGGEADRRMESIGDSVLERPRCRDGRNDVACVTEGGGSCPAREGDDPFHSILGGGPCWAVHPSDSAVALVALDAAVAIAGTAGTRTIPIAEFLRPPKHPRNGSMTLAPGEVITAFEIRGEAVGGQQRYRKAMQRGRLDILLVSLAAVKRRNGDVKLVLGGVAPYPWRVDSSVEEDTSSGNLDESDIATLADRALYDAEPLAKNQYKVEIAGALLREAIAELARQ